MDDMTWTWTGQKETAALICVVWAGVNQHPAPGGPQEMHMSSL